MRQWCEDCAKDLGFEVQTGKAEVADLTATIDKEAANAQALGTKIDELAADIATDEADLKAATAIRDKEAASFAAEEKELTTVIDMLQRAVAKFLRTCRCRNPRSRSSQAPSPPMRRT